MGDLGESSFRPTIAFYRCINVNAIVRSVFFGRAMSGKFDEREAFFTRRTDKTIISKRITDAPSGEKVRIASRIIAGEPGLMNWTRAAGPSEAGS